MRAPARTGTNLAFKAPLPHFDDLRVPSKRLRQPSVRRNQLSAGHRRCRVPPLLTARFHLSWAPLTQAYLRLAKIPFAVQDCNAPSAAPTAQLPVLDAGADLVRWLGCAVHRVIGLLGLAPGAVTDNKLTGVGLVARIGLLPCPYASSICSLPHAGGARRRHGGGTRPTGRVRSSAGDDRLSETEGPPSHHLSP